MRIEDGPGWVEELSDLVQRDILYPDHQHHHLKKKKKFHYFPRFF